MSESISSIPSAGSAPKAAPGRLLSSSALSRLSLSWPQVAALSVAGLVVAVGGAALGVYSSWSHSGKIAPGVRIQGEDVGGLSKKEAHKRLAKRFGYMSINVNTPEHSYRVPVAALGGRPQIARVVDYAYWYGRAGSLPSNMIRVLVDRPSHSIKLPIVWDKKEMRQTARILERKYNQPGRDARLQWQNGALQVVGEESGRALNSGATLHLLQKKYFPGLSHIKAVTMPVQARITAADLSGTDTKLGEYKTYFDSGLWGRTRNIRVASEAVEGSILMPGETLSFNNKTGERTWDKGYRMAHIFETKPGALKAEVVDGLAGGVCQVSSTLYNAVRKANKKNGRHLKIVERDTHSLPVTYVPAGLDATVAWPNRDFKFRNNFAFPVYVRTAVRGSRLTISIWGRVPYESSTRFANTTSEKKL
ncbi:MAG TPA: VanW family protein [Abditibacteriaceae bacterium]|nr:VanW family protein [Abditibacteriaceae bacterium]